MPGGTDFEIVFAGGVTGSHGVGVVCDVWEVGEDFPDGFFGSVGGCGGLYECGHGFCPSAMLFTNR